MTKKLKPRSLLFITAMRFESKVILKKHGGSLIQQETNLKLYQLWDSGFLFETGIGVKADKVAVARLLHETTPSLAINFGICGALNPKIKLGDCFLIDRICIPGEQPISISSNLKNFPSASLTTTTHAILNSRERDMLFRKTSCDLVDMEAATIYQLCNQQNIPMQIIKVVSDYSDAETMEKIKSSRHLLKNNLERALEKLWQALSIENYFSGSG